MNVIFICLSIVLSMQLNSAANDEAQNRSSSSSSMGRSSSKRIKGPKSTNISPKRQRSFDKKAPLKICHGVPGGRGSVSMKINMDEEDHFAKEKFTVLMREDFEQGIPWIVARHLYKTDEGELGEDVFDGRYLHAFLNKSKVRPTAHPLYKGEFIGEPLYFSVIKEGENVRTRFLGTEEETSEDSAKGEKMRALLDLNQRPELWAGISVCCLRLKEYADMTKWLNAALPELQTIPQEIPEGSSDSDAFTHAMDRIEQAIVLMEQRNFPYIYMLRKCAYAYLEENMTSKAIEMYHKIIETLQKEQKQCGKTLRRLGYAYYEVKNFEEALKFLEAALPVLKSEKRNYGYVLKYIGYIFNRRKEWVQAMHFLNEALPVLKEENEKIAGTLSMRGKIYFQLGLWHECIGSFYDLLEDTDRFTSKAYNWIGQAYEKMEKYKNAALSYRQACEADDAERETQFVNMLFLNATQPEHCQIIDEDEMKKIAKRLLASSQRDQEFYHKHCPERYAVALQEAECIVSFDSDDELQVNSSSD